VALLKKRPTNISGEFGPLAIAHPAQDVLK
jgi:hypothetical protein